MQARNHAGDTAETLILIGLILDIILEVVLLFVGLFFLIVPVLGGVLLALAIIGFVWVALVWGFSYSRVKAGDYEGARTPTLVFAILSLITLAIIPGVLFLIAYLKLGDALDEEVYAPAWAPSPFPPVPGAASASPPRFCAHCGRAAKPGATFCESCGAPLV